MNNTDTLPVTTDAAADAPAADQAPDIQLFNAGQTIELLSQLLGACVRKLCKLDGNPDGAVLIHQPDVDELEGFELQHGIDQATGAIALRVAKPLTSAELAAAN